VIAHPSRVWTVQIDQPQAGLRRKIRGKPNLDMLVLLDPLLKFEL
jgi:hypothetical protein